MKENKKHNTEPDMEKSMGDLSKKDLAKGYSRDDMDPKPKWDMEYVYPFMENEKW